MPASMLNTPQTRGEYYFFIHKQLLNRYVFMEILYVDVFLFPLKISSI